MYMSPGQREVIAIVLSTFNGERYIEAQLASIRAQSATDWVLYVRDDGSSDRTVERVRAVAAIDSRVCLLPADGDRLGAALSFGRLAEHAWSAGARYMLFADQDDVWLPGKLGRLLAVMSAVERRRGADTPILVHADLTVVGEDLTPIHPSFMRFQRIQHERCSPLRTLLAQNFVTGCAMAVNRALLDFALPFPPGVVMHDWWMAQCAAAAGELGFDPEPSVLYRQHSRNVVGARGYLGLAYRAVAGGAEWWERSLATFRAAVQQAGALDRRLRERARGEGVPAALVTRYSIAWTEPRGAVRLAAIRRLGVGPQAAGRRLLYYLRTLVAPPAIPEA